MSQSAATDATPDTATNAPTSSAGNGTADLSSIATGLADGMPEVQEHAVSQAMAQQQAANDAQADRQGVRFDPSIHVAGADGKGTLTVRGTWAQKRGRKAGAATPVAAPVTKSTLGGPAVPASPQVVQQQQNDALARASGVAAAEMLFIVGQMIGGTEWAPMQDKAMGLDERPTMHQAFGEYFVKTGTKDIPPGAALAFCILAYVAPRFAMPKTQTRFQKVKQFVATWWVNRRLRKAGLDPVETRKPAESAK